MSINESIQIGDEFEVTVEKLIYGGEGLARLGERVLFVPASAPGDHLRVRITAIEKRHLRAQIVKILLPSPLRRTAPCQYFGQCGGCQLQQLPYPAQLAAKAEFIRDALMRIGHISWPLPIEIKHAGEFGYRSRVQFKLERATQPLQIGFYQAGSHEVCDIRECAILAPELNEALLKLRAHRAEIASSTIPYTKLVLAKGETGVAANPAVAGFGNDVVVQSALGIKYFFDPECFFQVNQFLLETLVETVLAQRSGKLAIDLYAGVGLFALQLARRYQRVIATEVNARAVSFAEKNIRVNQLNNIEFHAISTERWLSKFTARVKDIDLIVLDPPRVGVIRKALINVVNMQPAEIVYVSCDPATLARDLRILIDEGYQLTSITGVDLFPQSYHIESIATLKRGSKEIKSHS